MGYVITTGILETYRRIDRLWDPKQVSIYRYAKFATTGG
jgi:hypothetical protein